MVFWGDFEGIGFNGGTGMDGGSQAEDMGGQGYEAIVTVGGFVIDGYPDRHRLALSG
jgi:hypothetical protein